MIEGPAYTFEAVLSRLRQAVQRRENGALTLPADVRGIDMMAGRLCHRPAVILSGCVTPPVFYLNAPRLARHRAQRWSGVRARDNGSGNAISHGRADCRTALRTIRRRLTPRPLGQTAAKASASAAVTQRD